MIPRLLHRIEGGFALSAATRRNADTTAFPRRHLTRGRDYPRIPQPGGKICKLSSPPSLEKRASARSMPAREKKRRLQ
jgi:hypothetical protein